MNELLTLLFLYLLLRTELLLQMRWGQRRFSSICSMLGLILGLKLLLEQLLLLLLLKLQLLLLELLLLLLKKLIVPITRGFLMVIVLIMM